MEVRPSDNPFFQPVSHDLGRTSEHCPDWKVNGRLPVFNSSQHKVEGNFSFLYSRESDKIGGRVPKPEINEAKMLSRTEFLKQRREKMLSEMTQEEREENSEMFAHSSAKPKVNPEDFLKIYKHEAKYEDPRYLTSGVSHTIFEHLFCYFLTLCTFPFQSEYGKKAPSVATIVVDRAVRPQGFSKSFNNVKPKNTSLTTALTKSNVHRTLDPQFA